MASAAPIETKDLELDFYANYLPPLDSFKIVSHTLFIHSNDSSNSANSIACFCKSRCQRVKNKIRCMHSPPCGFAIEANFLACIMNEKLIRQPKINVPICLRCQGCFMSCYRNKKWSTYMLPMYQCNCDADERNTTYINSDPKLLIGWNLDKVDYLRNNSGESEIAKRRLFGPKETINTDGTVTKLPEVRTDIQFDEPI